MKDSSAPTGQVCCEPRRTSVQAAIENRRFTKAYRTMAAALQRDPGLAQSWRANIACVVHDTPSSQTAWETANETADRLLSYLWGVPADYTPREHKQSVVEIDGVAYPTPPQVAGLLHAVSEERDELLANAPAEARRTGAEA